MNLDQWQGIASITKFDLGCELTVADPSDRPSSYFCSDLWDLASQFGSAGDAGRDHPPAGPSPGIVQELLGEKDSIAKALPRSAEEMYEMT